MLSARFLQGMGDCSRRDFLEIAGVGLVSVLFGIEPTFAQLDSLTVLSDPNIELFCQQLVDKLKKGTLDYPHKEDYEKFVKVILARAAKYPKPEQKEELQEAIQALLRSDHFPELEAYRKTQKPVVDLGDLSTKDTD